MKKKTKDIIYEDTLALEVKKTQVKVNSDYLIGDSLTGEHISGIKVFGVVQEIRDKDGQTQYLLLRDGRYYWCFPVSESSVSFTEWGTVGH